jgi:hypothetical protein
MANGCRQTTNTAADHQNPVHREESHTMQRAAAHHHHHDFEDTWLAATPDALDAADQMAMADRADWMLLRLVLCAAGATLLLAVAGSLGLAH